MFNSKNKFALTAIISFLFLSNPGQAADLGVGDFQEPITPVTFQNWNGFWLGIGGGYGAMNNEFNAVALPGAGLPGVTIDGFGGQGGVLTAGLGLDFQLGSQWVFGLLGDYDWSAMKSKGGIPAGAFGLAGAGAAYKLDVKYQYALGARTGFLANPNTLLYLTGGWTRLKMDSVAGVAGGAGGFFAAPKFNGWFIGGGAETMLGNWFGLNSSNVSLKLEYRYSDYNRKVLAATGVPAGTALTTLEPSTHTGRLSVNYKFNFFN